MKRNHWQEDFEILKKYHEIAGHCIKAAKFLVPESSPEERLEMIEEGTRLSEMLMSIPYFYSDRYYLVIRQAGLCRRMIKNRFLRFITAGKEEPGMPLEDICGEDIVREWHSSKFGVRTEKIKELYSEDWGWTLHYKEAPEMPFSECCARVFSGNMCVAKTAIAPFQAEHFVWKEVRFGRIKPIAERIQSLGWEARTKIPYFWREILTRGFLLWRYKEKEYRNPKFRLEIWKDAGQEENIELQVHLGWDETGWMDMDDGIDLFCEKMIGKERRRILVYDYHPSFHSLKYLVFWDGIDSPGHLSIHHHDGMSYMNPSPEAYLTLSLTMDELIGIFEKLKPSQIK